MASLCVCVDTMSLLYQRMALCSILLVPAFDDADVWWFLMDLMYVDKVFDSLKMNVS